MKFLWILFLSLAQFLLENTIRPELKHNPQKATDTQQFMQQNRGKLHCICRLCYIASNNYKANKPFGTHECLGHVTPASNFWRCKSLFQACPPSASKPGISSGGWWWGKTHCGPCTYPIVTNGNQVLLLDFRHQRQTLRKGHQITHDENCLGAPLTHLHMRFALFWKTNTWLASEVIKCDARVVRKLLSKQCRNVRNSPRRKPRHLGDRLP